MLDLNAIAARRAAITGAQWPWMREGVRNDYGDNVFVWAVADGSEYYSVEQQLAEGFGRAQICLITGGSDADWEFIAAAPTDIAALLAEVERLRAALRMADAQTRAQHAALTTAWQAARACTCGAQTTGPIEAAYAAADTEQEQP